jgi:hypothetical protein
VMGVGKTTKVSLQWGFIGWTSHFFISNSISWLKRVHGSFQANEESLIQSLIFEGVYPRNCICSFRVRSPISLRSLKVPWLDDEDAQKNFKKGETCLFGGAWPNPEQSYGQQLIPL